MQTAILTIKTKKNHPKRHVINIVQQKRSLPNKGNNTECWHNLCKKGIVHVFKGCILA